MDKGQVSLDDVLIEMDEDDVEMLSPKEKEDQAKAKIESKRPGAIETSSKPYTKTAEANKTKQPSSPQTPLTGALTSSEKSNNKKDIKSKKGKSSKDGCCCTIF